jgi:hypothetical protein
MKRNYSYMEPTMTNPDRPMNETRAATMRRVLADESLLNLLPEQDREVLIRLYTGMLQRWEDRKSEE